MGLHRNSLDLINGNLIKSVPRHKVEQVFQQHLPTKRVSKRFKVLELCRLVDKTDAGEISLAEFKVICQACNYKCHVDTEKVSYKLML